MEPFKCPPCGDIYTGEWCPTCGAPRQQGTIVLGMDTVDEPSPDTQLVSSTLGEVQRPVVDGEMGWPEFEVTLRYRVESDDPEMVEVARQRVWHNEAVEVAPWMRSLQPEDPVVACILAFDAVRERRGFPPYLSTHVVADFLTELKSRGWEINPEERP